MFGFEQVKSLKYMSDFKRLMIENNFQLEKRSTESDVGVKYEKWKFYLDGISITCAIYSDITTNEISYFSLITPEHVLLIHTKVI